MTDGGQLSNSFMKDKIALTKIEMVFTAKPSDKLDIFTDYSESDWVSVQ